MVHWHTSVVEHADRLPARGRRKVDGEHDAKARFQWQTQSSAFAVGDPERPGREAAGGNRQEWRTGRHGERHEARLIGHGNVADLTRTPRREFYDGIRNRSPGRRDDARVEA